MAAWRTVIVEDAPTVAEVHRRLVASVPGLRDRRHRARPPPRRAGWSRCTARTCCCSTSGCPDGDGLALLRALRGAREPVEVIAVTAARGAQVVRECVHLGVVDYLVKPFAPERLRQALGLFAHRMHALHDGELAQTEVDRLCASGRRAGARAAARPRPGDARPGPRRAARGRAAERRRRSPSAAGVSRVTARRYLEYLAASGEVSTEADGRRARAGRPRRTRFRSRAPDHNRHRHALNP